MISNTRTVATVDSARLHVLAHPLRTQLIGLLRREGPATATTLARRLGTNSGQTSYHLRQLAEVGLVEEDATRGNGRDRWWRAAHDSTSWSSVQFRADVRDRAADDWLVGYHARLHARWLQDWLETRDEWPEAWLEASDLSDFRLRLTPERATELAQELHAVIERYREQGDESGGEWFTVLLHAFPQPEASV